MIYRPRGVFKAYFDVTVAYVYLATVVRLERR